MLYFSFNNSLVNLVTINGLNLMNTKDLRSYNNMFLECTNFNTLDVSNFLTAYITNMNSTFRSCFSLTSLDLSNWNTSNVTNMTRMFDECYQLTSLDVSNFDTSKVSNMSGMFGGCGNLSYIKCTIQFKEWCWENQDRIELPIQMREGGSGTWDTIALAVMSDTEEKPIIFDGEPKQIIMNGEYQKDEYHTLEILSPSVILVKQPIAINPDCVNLINNPSNLKYVDGFNKLVLPNEIDNLFYGNQIITSLDLSNCDSTAVTSMYETFSSCNKLTSLNLSNWYVYNVQNLASLFDDCPSLIELDLRGWEINPNANIDWMFHDCSNLSLIKCSKQFKDWCLENADEFALPDTMREGGGGIWELTD